MKPQRAMDTRCESNEATSQASAIVSTHKNRSTRRLRSLMFAFGDGMFLMLVSVAATALMHLLHQANWNLALTLLCGMLIAMVVQISLALAVAPLLGSIESMVPSMVAAMVSPMAVCLSDVTGIHLDWRMSLALGAGVGAGIFLLIQAYAFACCRRFKGRFMADEV